MKKIMILAVSLIVSISSFAGYKDDMMIRMEIKEKSVEKSFGGSNAEMKNAAAAIYEGWNEELNKVYKLLMVKLSKNEQLKLRDEERAWIKKRDKAAKAEANKFCDTVNGERLCGTGYGLAYTESLIATTKERAVELSKRYEKITKNKNLKILETEMKSQSDKVVEVFHKEISDRIESKNKIIQYSENTNLETGEKNLKVNLPDILLNNKFYEKTIFEIEGVNFSSKNKAEVIYIEKSPNMDEVMFSDEFEEILIDKVSEKLGYELDKEKIQNLSNEEKIKVNTIIFSEYQKEMLKRLDNNQFEYETEKKKMIFQKIKEEWKYKDEETLESDSSDNNSI